MNTIDERIAKKMEGVEQLKRQKKAQEVREKQRQEAIDKDRQRIIGKIVTEIFPEVLRFQPKRVTADNEIEFAPLANFLSELAADSELVAGLKELVIQKSALHKQQEPTAYPPSDV